MNSGLYLFDHLLQPVSKPSLYADLQYFLTSHSSQRYIFHNYNHFFFTHSIKENPLISIHSQLDIMRIVVVVAAAVMAAASVASATDKYSTQSTVVHVNYNNIFLILALKVRVTNNPFIAQKWVMSLGSSIIP